MQLRKHEILSSLAVKCGAQDWTVELRERLSGKCKGQIYKCFIRESDKKQFWALRLVVECRIRCLLRSVAKKRGFDDPEGKVAAAHAAVARARRVKAREPDPKAKKPSE